MPESGIVPGFFGFKDDSRLPGEIPLNNIAVPDAEIRDIEEVEEDLNTTKNASI